MRKLLRTLLCICCAALMLCLPAFAEQLPEGYEVKTYTDENNHEVQEIYDKSGLLAGKSFTDPSGVQIVELYFYDENHLLIMKETIDSNGKDVEEHYSYFEGTSTLSSKTIVDNEKNRLDEEYYPNGSLKSAYSKDAAGNISSTSYNEDGTLDRITMADAAGNETMEYYKNGVLSEKRYNYPDGSKLYERWDENETLTYRSSTDAEGNETNENYENGILSSKTYNYPDGSKLYEQWDENEKLTYRSSTDAEGNQKIEHLSISNGHTEIEYLYADGSRTMEGYDENGALYYKLTLDASGKEIFSTSISWYSSGGVVHGYAWTTVQDGIETREEYDLNGTLLSKTVTSNNDNQIHRIENHLPDGTLENYTLRYPDANGAQVMEFYTPDGVLTQRYVEGAEKTVNEHYEAGKLSFSEVSYMKDDEEWVETYAADGSMTRYQIFSKDADGRSLNRVYTPEGILKTVYIFYQENGVDYERTEYYEKDGTLSKYHICHAEGEKWIEEHYDASGTLVEKLVYDAEENRIE